MNYDVWYLASGGDKFQAYIEIPLSLAGSNTTACVKWLVCMSSVKYRARQLYKNISMLFLFPVKDGKLSTGVIAIFNTSCYG